LNPIKAIIAVIKQRNSIQYIALFWACLLFVSYKLLAPATHSGIDIPHLDKLAHAAIFFVLCGLLMRAYSMSWLQYFTVFAVYGLITEYLQAQTGHRSGDVLDWLANMTGVILLFIAQLGQTKLFSQKAQKIR
jgi:VanZ family protein